MLQMILARSQLRCGGTSYCENNSRRCAVTHGPQKGEGETRATTGSCGKEIMTGLANVTRYESESTTSSSEVSDQSHQTTSLSAQRKVGGIVQPKKERDPLTSCCRNVALREREAEKKQMRHAERRVRIYCPSGWPVRNFRASKLAQ